VNDALGEFGSRPAAVAKKNLPLLDPKYRRLRYDRTPSD
jgi:hypothetical protein